MCTRTQLQIITSAVRKMYEEQYKDSVRDILLYGSYAREDNNDDSGIDIAGIVDGDRYELQKQLKTIWNESADLGYQYNVVVSPVVIP